MSDHSAHDTHHEGHHHVTPLWVYNAVGGGLLFMTAVTVWIANFDFGPANTLIAMLVATVKASLVALFFMHLLHEERLNAVTFVFGLLFVGLFFLFPLVDLGTRTYVDPIMEPLSETTQKRMAVDRNANSKVFRQVKAAVGGGDLVIPARPDVTAEQTALSIDKEQSGNLVKLRRSAFIMPDPAELDDPAAAP